jgi:DHA1 family multidrug resistance protein-like MFS transporter
MSFATSVFQMFILRLLTGVFSGFTAASIAMVGSNTPEEKLGKAMGTLQLGQITGTVVGPLVGGVLCDILSYSAVLMMGSILCLVGGILVYVLLKEEHVKTESKKTNLFKSMKQTFETRALLPMFLVLFLAQFSLKIVEPILSLFVKTLYTNKEYLSTMSGIVFGVTGVSNIIGVFVLGNLSEKIGNRKLLTFSLIGGGISYFLQALASNLTMLIVLRVMLGFFMAGILPSANALVGQLTSREKRGAAYGLTASATFLGGFLGPLSGGFISSAVGLRAVFPITAGLMIFNAFWVVIAKKKSEK